MAKRDLAVFALLATTGLRASELCALRDDDFRADGGETRLTVLGKGDKQRVVPVPPETVTVMHAYRAERDARLGPRPLGAATFLLTNGSTLTRHALDKIVDTWVRRAGVPKQDGEAAHAFRHSFAKGLIRNGVPVPVVQALLGHEDLRTTGIYTKATAADVLDGVLASPARGILRGLRVERLED